MNVAPLFRSGGILVALALLAPVRGATPAAELFVEHCAPCHGPDGKAHTPAGRKLGAKDLSQSKLGDSDIQKQIVNGSKTPRGVEKMPSFREKLSAAEIELLIAYVKTFRP